MAVLEVGTIRYALVDEQGYKADYWLSLPTDEVQPVDMSQSLALSHTSVLRPTLCTAQLDRLVITVPYSETESALTTPLQGMSTKQRMRFEVQPGYRKVSQHLNVPAFKHELLSRALNGRNSWAYHQGATLTLVNAWLNGLGGVKPCNPYEQDYTWVDIGILQTRGNWDGIQ
jgi:hypothetical protein